VDDKSVAQRVENSLPTYGDANVPWITEAGQLLAYQDVAFEETVTFAGDYPSETYSFIAKLVTQRGSIQTVRNFELTLTDEDGEYTAVIALARDETLRLPNRCWWRIAAVIDETGEEIEVVGGDFFCRKSFTAIL